jgi:hypothetical protein
MRHNASTKSQTTCYVVAYDIPDDKRRTKVHKILLGYGTWTQYLFLSRKKGAICYSKREPVR